MVWDRLLKCNYRIIFTYCHRYNLFEDEVSILLLL